MAAAALCEFSSSAGGLALAYEEASKDGTVDVFTMATWKKMWGAHAQAAVMGSTSVPGQRPRAEWGHRL